MTRLQLAYRLLIQIYGKLPNDDASSSVNLVNIYVSEAIAAAAKQSARENLQIEGVSFLNNSFYTTFNGLTVSAAGTIVGDFKCTLPNIPIGLGRNDGIATVRLFGENTASIPLMMMAVDTVEYMNRMPKPKTTPCWNEGSTLYFRNPTLDLTKYTATVRMVSGGDAADLNSELNVPDEFLPQIHVYVRDALLGMRAAKPDLNNDGIDKN